MTGLLRDHCAGRRPLPVWLPVVMLLWANLHPGVITGQVLLACAIAWEWINRRWRLNPPLDRAAAWRLTWVGGLGLAATFALPDPIERMLYPFHGEVWHPVQRLFTEIRPLHTFLLTPPYATNLTLVVFALVLVTVVFRFRQYRLWELGLLAGMTWLAFRSVRSMMDWLLLMLALGVPHLTALLRQWLWAWRRKPAGAALRSFNRGLRALNGRTLQPQWFWPAATCAVLVVLSLIPPVARRMPVTGGGDLADRRGRLGGGQRRSRPVLLAAGLRLLSHLAARGDESSLRGHARLLLPARRDRGRALPAADVLGVGGAFGAACWPAAPTTSCWRRPDRAANCGDASSRTSSRCTATTRPVLLRSDRIRGGLQRSASAASRRPLRRRSELVGRPTNTVGSSGAPPRPRFGGEGPGVRGTEPRAAASPPHPRPLSPEAGARGKGTSNLRGMARP